MQYVALLRGINVGGNNRVEMSRLKTVCESLGWVNVRTTPSAIIWKVDRVNASRSGLLRMMGTPLYRRVTVRNITTVRKLGQRIDEAS